MSEISFRILNLWIDAVGEKHLPRLVNSIVLLWIEIWKTKLESPENSVNNLISKIEGLRMMGVVGLGEFLARSPIVNHRSSPEVLHDVILLYLILISSVNGGACKGNISAVLEVLVGVILLPIFLRSGGNKISECVVNVDGDLFRHSMVHNVEKSRLTDINQKLFQILFRFDLADVNSRDILGKRIHRIPIQLVSFERRELNLKIYTFINLDVVIDRGDFVRVVIYNLRSHLYGVKGNLSLESAMRVVSADGCVNF